jgi:tetratricopeptide (TPR) repeat protein
MTRQAQVPKSSALAYWLREIGSRRWLSGVCALLSVAAVASAHSRWQREPSAATEARSAFVSGQYDQAAAALDRWLHVMPRASEAHFLKSRVAVADSQLRDAIRELERARALGHPRDELAQLEALIASKAGRLTEAEPTLRNFFDNNPRPDRQVNEALAKVYLETYNLARAAIVLDRWTNDFPADAKPYLWRAEIHSRTGGDFRAVESDYRDALKRDPALARAHLGLADELCKAHRNQEAALEYEAYLAFEPADAAAHIGAARNMRELGDDAAARAHLKRAQALDGNNAEIFKQLAEDAAQRNDWPAAISSLDRAVELAPFDVAVRHSRSLVLAKLGRADEARTEQAAAIRLRQDLDRLGEARRKLIASPQDWQSQLIVARWMFDHDHGPEGVRWAEKILADRPGDVEASRLLADYHERRGERGLANFYRVNAPREPTNSAAAPKVERE